MQGGENDQSGHGRQDDHLKVQSHMAGATAGDGSWNEGVTTRTKTTTRTYTDSDGTLITEVSFPYDNLIFTGSKTVFFIAPASVQYMGPDQWPKPPP